MEQTTNHLRRLGHETLFKSPSLSRYFFDRSVKSICSKNEREKFENNTLFSRCSYCYNPLQSGNYSMKLSPKPGLKKQEQRLMKRMGQNKQNIGNYQKKSVQDYVNKPNKLIIVCALCKKTRTVNCQSRLERQKQKESVEKEREEQEQMELPVEPVKTRRDKKKERRKLLRRKKHRGELDDDKDAGLLIPTSDKTDDDKQEENKNVEEIRTEGRILDNQGTKPIAVNETVSVSGNDRIGIDNVGSAKATADVKHGTHSSVLSNLIDISEKTSGKRKSGLNKISLTDRARKFPTTVSEQMSHGIKGNRSVIGQCQKSVTDKKKKAKKMSQQLGRLLKQEQNKSNSGSLTDFLSSL